jgi:hypothetical protein
MYFILLPSLLMKTSHFLLHILPLTVINLLFILVIPQGLLHGTLQTTVRLYQGWRMGSSHVSVREDLYPVIY